MLQTAVWADAQRALKASILDGNARLSRPARDLAANLLLNLDDMDRCWREAATWLCDFLEADRIDGGFHSSLDTPYRPQIEVQRKGDSLPSILDATFHPRSAGSVTTWTQPTPTFFGDVSRDSRLDQPTRSCLAWHGSGSKLALPLIADRFPVGIICADWVGVRSAPPGFAEETLVELSTQVLGPILSSARSLATVQAHGRKVRSAPESLSCLTAAELRIACLVAQGMSYKEVARQVGSSFPTVDHHLRSMRAKFDVTSTAQLTSRLKQLFLETPETT